MDSEKVDLKDLDTFFMSFQQLVHKNSGNERSEATVCNTHVNIEHVAKCHDSNYTILIILVTSSQPKRKRNKINQQQ